MSKSHKFSPKLPKNNTRTLQNPFEPARPRAMQMDDFGVLERPSFTPGACSSALSPPKAASSVVYSVPIPHWKDSAIAAANMQSCNLDRNYLCLYLSASAAFALFYQSFHDIGLSTLITLAVLIQVLALSALLIGVVGRQSVQGVSARSLQMQAVSFGLRLCSTSWLKGYIPVDSTGDGLYQLADLAAFFLCLRLNYLTNVTYVHTYQKEADGAWSGTMVVACLILASVVHPDLNNRPLFDAIWTAALYVDVVSTLPQLWMMGTLGGKVDAFSAHYVALIALSRFIDGIFWFHGFDELAPDSGSFNVAGWFVFGSHVIHIMLMWDFLFLYGKAIYKGKILHREFDFAAEAGFDL